MKKLAITSLKPKSELRRKGIQTVHQLAMSKHVILGAISWHLWRTPPRIIDTLMKTVHLPHQKKKSGNVEVI